MLHTLGQGVNVVQNAGNVCGDFIGRFACPVRLVAGTVLEGVDGDIIVGGQHADDAGLCIAVPDQVIHLHIIHAAGGFCTGGVQRLHDAQNGIAAAGAQFLHIVTVAVTDVDDFSTMGSALHINAGQV